MAWAWPTPAFSGVPTLREAARLAAEIRGTLVLPTEATDVAQCARAARAEVGETTLGAERGGLQGMLVPLDKDRFRISIDPTPRGGWAGLDRELTELVAGRRARFLIAHELAHTLFYRRTGGSVPHRSLEGGSSDEEEFCDEFARALLVPSRPGLVTAEDVRADHERYNVSLELAARAAASRDTAPSLALWRWDAAAPGRRAALHVQWSSDRRLPRELDVQRYRTDPRDLPALFAAGAKRLGTHFTAIILPTRRQALAVLT
jgi:hypothetical protein